MKYLLTLALALALTGCATGTVPQTANETKTHQRVYNGYNLIFPGLYNAKGPVITFEGEGASGPANAGEVTIHQTNSGDADSTQQGTVTPTNTTETTGTLTK